MTRAVLVALVASVGLVTCANRERPSVAPAPREFFALAEDSSQALFDDAVRWSRATHMETGGCFHIFSVFGRTVFVVDATERVVWRRRDSVQLDCAASDGTWHTHWAPEDETHVGCSAWRAADLYLISDHAPLGLIICGEGRDSVIPYAYSSEADSAHQAYLRTSPEAAKAAVDGTMTTRAYRCADEPKASRERPVLHCHR